MMLFAETSMGEVGGGVAGIITILYAIGHGIDYLFKRRDRIRAQELQAESDVKKESQEVKDAEDKRDQTTIGHLREYAAKMQTLADERKNEMDRVVKDLDKEMEKVVEVFETKLTGNNDELLRLKEMIGALQGYVLHLQDKCITRKISFRTFKEFREGTHSVPALKETQPPQ